MDQQLPQEQRTWLRCEIDDDADNVMIVLARKEMLETAVRRGVGEPIYMDATHGLQKYGLKVITVHVKDEESQGMPSILSSWLQAPLLHDSWRLPTRFPVWFTFDIQASFCSIPMASPCKGCYKVAKGYRIQHDAPCSFQV